MNAERAAAAIRDIPRSCSCLWLFSPPRHRWVRWNLDPRCRWHHPITSPGYLRSVRLEIDQWRYAQ